MVDLLRYPGVDFCMKDLLVGGRVVRLSLWDTAGQERFQSVTRQYFRAMHAIVYVYDITRKETFHHLEEVWMPQFQENNTTPDVVQMVIGNKLDKASEREVLPEVASELFRKMGCLYSETSAATSEGILEAFLLGLISTMMQQPLLVDQAEAWGEGCVLLETRLRHRRPRGCCG